ncbi:MAG: DUF4910 domain-containing protein [Candidatus Margulisbacteria bacterium]|nr:DUF4910 domain-containing protein [Candidatus Margulisiibacteriota bacterium]
MMELLKKIYPLRLAPVSPDTDRAAAILCQVLPFKVHEYPSGDEHNGWLVPDSWEAHKALVSRDGQVIYDGMKHPLGVAGYSTSFKGKVSLQTLKEHLFHHPSLPGSLVYHCDYYYKPWKKDWGLCVSREFFDRLEDGRYEVEIETSFKKGTMKVLDYLLPGEKKETIILNAHNCHAGQANDDIAGVVVAIEVMKRLAARKKRKYSYRVVIAPEHLGTVFYLKNLPDRTTADFRYAMFLEMLGNDNRFALQESMTGQSLIDKAARQYLGYNQPDYFSDRFRKIVGNDETVWEAPGYEIPCISLSRAPYPEYHSDLDNEAIISEQRLAEAVEAVLGIIDIIETNARLKRHFKGLVALSNPKFDLYVSTIDPSIRREVSDEQRKWNRLMDYLPRYFNEKTNILDIAIKHELDYKKVFEYISKFRDKGLVSFLDAGREENDVA